MLTVGSLILAVINMGIMWAMAHGQRYAWHGNFVLQLLWLPYDVITRQYGLAALVIVLIGVSLKACRRSARTQAAPPARARARHRRKPWWVLPRRRSAVTYP